MKTKLSLIKDQSRLHEYKAELQAQAVVLADMVEMLTGKAPTIDPPKLNGGSGYLLEDCEAMDHFVDTLKGLVIQAKGQNPKTAAASPAPAPAPAPATPPPAKPSANQRILAANGYTVTGKKLSLDEELAATLADNNCKSPAELWQKQQSEAQDKALGIVRN